MKFERLIKKRSKKYNIQHKKDGYWDGPNWIEGEKVPYEIDATIFPVTAKEVQRYEGLGYTTQDIKIFIVVPIKAYNLQTEQYETIELKEDDSIVYQGDNYIFDDNNDRTTNADFVKWIAVRDQEGDGQ